MSGRLKATVAGVGLLAVAWVALGSRDPVPRLTFLAVGQGDAIVWQDGGITMLVDTGPKSREGLDAGKRIVLPKLRRMGIGSIDLLLITHPDSDHIGGLGSLVDRFPAAKVVVSSAFKANEDMAWWLHQSGLRDEKIIWVDGRNRFRFGNSTVEVAAPTILPGDSDNEGSLFVRITRGNASAVLTGDASVDTEIKMQRELKWQAQVLKAGHHGSRTSTSEAFVKSINPTWAVVSCGRDNKFEHPHRSVLQTFDRNAVKVYRTDLQGDIAFEAREDGFVPLLRNEAVR